MTATISIGPLQSSHCSQIEEIVRATGVFNRGEVAVAMEVFDAATGMQKAEGQKDYEAIGAFDGDSIVGYACFGPTPSTDRTYDLYWIAVHPDAQRGGAGGALMDEVERQLEARRARLLVIETSSRPDYEPTRHFYQKRGYRESARLRDFYAAGDDRVVLTRRVVVPDAQGAASLPYPNTRI